MTPKYTNTISTARHRRLGPLQLIHINLEPWLCLEDLARVLEVSSQKLSGILQTHPQVPHVTGCHFIQMSKNSLPRKLKQPAVQRWINRILNDSGLKGPSASAKASKSARKSINLTVRLDIIHKICEDTFTFEEWKDYLLSQFVRSEENFVEISAAFEMDRIPEETARVTMICQAPDIAHSRSLWVALYEAQRGWHTQSSLEHAVDLAEALIPDDSDTVDAGALHEFLQITDPFDVWFNSQIYWQKFKPGKDYFIEGGLRFLPLDNHPDGGSVQVRLSVKSADDIISRVKSPRGASMREMIELEKECLEAAGA
jgi:hypothetical protein